MSLIEAVTNVVVGFFVAVLAQVVTFPWFGLDASLATSFAVGGIFTGVSIVRSYLLRRLFEAIRVAGESDD